MVRHVFLSLCMIMTVSYLSVHTTLDAQTPTPTSVPTPTTKGHIYGMVTDKDGGLVSGAEVILKSKKLQFQDSEVTDTNGEYEFSDLNAGQYILKVKESGHKKAKKTIKLKQGEDKMVDIELKKKGSGGGGGGNGGGGGGGNGGGSGGGSGSGGGNGGGSGSGSGLGSVKK